MTMAYSDPAREAVPHSRPDVEVFYRSQQDFALADVMTDGRGWWWWSRFPGCLPDSDPVGPFDTEALALADAQNRGDRPMTEQPATKEISPPPDDIDDIDEPLPCILCNGPLELKGRLCYREWLRCRNCGMDYGREIPRLASQEIGP